MNVTNQMVRFGSMFGIPLWVQVSSTDTYGDILNKLSKAVNNSTSPLIRTYFKDQIGIVYEGRMVITSNNADNATIKAQAIYGSVLAALLRVNLEAVNARP